MLVPIPISAPSIDATALGPAQSSDDEDYQENEHDGPDSDVHVTSPFVGGRALTPSAGEWVIFLYDFERYPQIRAINGL
jgi:hypothetical protein